MGFSILFFMLGSIENWEKADTRSTSYIGRKKSGSCLLRFEWHGKYGQTCCFFLAKISENGFYFKILIQIMQAFVKRHFSCMYMCTKQKQLPS
jgi:hypothetical protein